MRALLAINPSSIFLPSVISGVAVAVPLPLSPVGQNSRIDEVDENGLHSNANADAVLTDEQSYGNI